ncbi:hypothetical protein BLOT_010735 [Blomia tropicalis]|nr:hypothetical protein BLOT_010735 [Blomia tropicalis]
MGRFREHSATTWRWIKVLKYNVLPFYGTSLGTFGYNLAMDQDFEIQWFILINDGQSYPNVILNIQLLRRLLELDERLEQIGSMTPEHSSIGDSCVIIVERYGQTKVGKKSLYPSTSTTTYSSISTTTPITIFILVLDVHRQHY